MRQRQAGPAKGPQVHVGPAHRVFRHRRAGIPSSLPTTYRRWIYPRPGFRRQEDAQGEFSFFILARAKRVVAAVSNYGKRRLRIAFSETLG